MSMRKPKRKLTFDPAKEAESLYFTLLKRGEYVSAASILNRLLGLSGDNTPDDAPKAGSIDVSTLSDADFQELGLLLEPLQAFKKRVGQHLDIDRERQRLEPPPLIATNDYAPVAPFPAETTTPSPAETIVVDDDPEFDL